VYRTHTQVVSLKDKASGILSKGSGRGSHLPHPQGAIATQYKEESTIFAIASDSPHTARHWLTHAVKLSDRTVRRRGRTERSGRTARKANAEEITWEISTARTHARTKECCSHFIYRHSCTLRSNTRARDVKRTGVVHSCCAVSLSLRSASAARASAVAPLALSDSVSCVRALRPFGVCPGTLHMHRPPPSLGSVYEGMAMSSIRTGAQGTLKSIVLLCA
jgi:hypothetical protein